MNLNLMISIAKFTLLLVNLLNDAGSVWPNKQDSLITNARIHVHLELTRGIALTAVTGKQWGSSFEFLEK